MMLIDTQAGCTHPRGYLSITMRHDIPGSGANSFPLIPIHPKGIIDRSTRIILTL